jgi:IMP dehydrogenase/GMP reductase
MHIQVVRRGGIAGVTLRGAADSAEVAGAGAGVEEILRSLPSGRPESPGRPDRFRYEITVTDGERSQTAHFAEDELPTGLRPLVSAALAHGTVD